MAHIICAALAFCALATMLSMASSTSGWVTYTNAQYVLITYALYKRTAA
jgi:hypothetical protein